MKSLLNNLIRLLVLSALLLTTTVAFAQDEAEAENTTVPPFIGIRYTPAADGLFVTGVIPNTPAETAQLAAGDVITAVDGEAIRVETVREVVWKHPIGATVTLSGLRDGSAFERALTLMARPEDLFSNPDYLMPLDMATLGLFVGQCNDHLLVIGAAAGTEIASAGFHMYDQILTIDGDKIRSIAEGDAAVSDLSDGDVLSFEILRGEQEMTIKVIVVDRRRHPRKPVRRPYPRSDIYSVYNADSIKLGYGADFIEVQELSETHDLYAAGLRPYDLITAANDAPLASAKDFFNGADIELTVQRPNGALEFDVPASTAALLMFGDAAPAEQDRSQWLGMNEKQVTLGVRYWQLEPGSPYFQGAAVTQGAYIAEVIEGLPAAQAGLQVDDIIVAVDGEAVTLEIDLRNRIYFHEPGDEVAIDFLRDGEMMRAMVTLRVAR